MRRGLLDTSVFIAHESGRILGDLPEEIEEVAVSVVTLAELELGVLNASDASVRSTRLKTLSHARDLSEPLPVDQNVASEFAALVAQCRESGKRLTVQDAWIAATARAHRAVLCTQDEGFDEIPGVEVKLV